MVEQRTSGRKSGTSLERARRTLREHVAPTGGTEAVPLRAADGRVVAREVTARRNVPHYARAAMDGFAIRSSDTDGAAEAPVTLALTDGDVGPGEAGHVHTGSEIPAGADAVVRVERTEPVEGGIRVARTVPEGKDVAPVGEDVRAGQHLYAAGHRLRPSDVGLLKSVGVREVTVYGRPTVGVIPTGEELVQSDPGPGETVETNGLTVAQYVERWGGVPRYRDVVTDDEDALRAAIEAECDADLVVTTGGSSVGDRDLVPAVVEGMGDLLVHGVSIKPGHPVGIGVVEGTPVLLLPGYPVSCIVNAVQFLRPALAWCAGTDPTPLPTTRATLADAIESDRGTRRFERVRLHEDGGTVATPTAHSGAGVLSSVALADGWVEVPESEETLPTGTEVAVQDWEWYP